MVETYHVYPDSELCKSFKGSLHDGNGQTPLMTCSCEDFDTTIDCEIWAPGLMVDAHVAGRRTELSFTDMMMNCSNATRAEPGRLLVNTTSRNMFLKV